MTIFPSDLAALDKLVELRKAELALQTHPLPLYEAACAKTERAMREAIPALVRLLETFRGVEKLPEKWRTNEGFSPAYGAGRISCSSELSALLGEQSKGGGG